MSTPVNTFRTSADDERLRQYDRYVHALTAINSTHRVIHDGMGFHATTRKTALAAAASFDILLVSGALRPHLNGVLFSVTGGPCDIKTYEGTTTSADGTSITIFNRNRNSSTTAVATLFHTPTVTDVGTLIHDRLSPSAGKDTGNLTPTLGEEWVLALSTKYLVRITNNSGAPIDITMEALWYEPNYET